ncbi:MAG TPA: hypothetical protein VFW41_10120 [Gaiellaceae bacterium]|nr:hypothetical protein [Gaiellaceae bacterium]
MLGAGTPAGAVAASVTGPGSVTASPRGDISTWTNQTPSFRLSAGSQPRRWQMRTILSALLLCRYHPQ